MRSGSGTCPAGHGCRGPRLSPSLAQRWQLGSALAVRSRCCSALTLKPGLVPRQGSPGLAQLQGAREEGSAGRGCLLQPCPSRALHTRQGARCALCCSCTTSGFTPAQTLGAPYDGPLGRQGEPQGCDGASPEDACGL